MSVQEEFERYLGTTRPKDPDICARRLNLTKMMLRVFPEAGEDLIKEGIEKGIEHELMTLTHLFERRLNRALTAEEHRALRERFTRLSPNRLGDVVLDLSAEALAAWLADPHAV